MEAEKEEIEEFTFWGHDCIHKTRVEARWFQERLNRRVKRVSFALSAGITVLWNVTWREGLPLYSPEIVVCL